MMNDMPETYCIQNGYKEPAEDHPGTYGKRNEQQENSDKCMGGMKAALSMPDEKEISIEP